MRLRRHAPEKSTDPYIFRFRAKTAIEPHPYFIKKTSGSITAVCGLMLPDVFEE
jgi:hypothetical protein